MKYYSHLNTAKELLEQHDGQEPFGLYLKKFFSANKKYGSKDRKNIAQLCYAYFRLGKALRELPMEQRLLMGWNEEETISYPVTDIFPWKEELSKDIDHKTFCQSFLTQPDLFLRIRPGQAAVVKAKLNEAAILFKELTPTCIELPNATKIDTLIEIDKEAVIQDYSSQRIGEFFPTQPKPRTVWDACAASGGKSILAYDLLKPIGLTVSDLRQTILINLEKRFAHAGIQDYEPMIGDLSEGPAELPPFDLIIADVPCTGSGTWSRTPEQLFYFDTRTIEKYSLLQKKILRNIIPNVKPGGHLLYITCSVFEKENEGAVRYIEKQGLKLERMEMLKGYEQKADTMFVALFTTL